MKRRLFPLLPLLLSVSFVFPNGNRESPDQTSIRSPGNRADSSSVPGTQQAGPPVNEVAAESSAPDFIVNNGSEPETLDPHFAQSLSEQRLVINLFEGLLSNDPETALPVPGLAESWEVSEDGKTYTFFLRNAVWSDGTPITARTVAESLLRVLDPKLSCPYAWLPAKYINGAQDFKKGNTGSETVGVKAKDDATLILELAAPCPYFPSLLPHPAFAVVPMHVLEKHGENWTKPGIFVSNGPYILKEWRALDRIIVAENTRYWDRERVALKQVSFLPGIDPENSAQWHTSMSGEIVAEMADSPEIHKSLYLGTYYYLFNCKKQPFSDVRVRKALCLAADRAGLIENVLKMSVFPAETLVPPLEGYAGVTGLAFNLDEAKRLLAQAGFPGGKSWPRVTLLYNDAPGHKEIAAYLRARWKENLGIDIEFAERGWDTFLSLKNGGDFSIVRAGWLGEYPDPDTFLELLKTDSVFNSGGYSGKEYDVLLQKAAELNDSTERNALLAEAETLLLTADAPLLPLYFYAAFNRIDLDQWGGWYPNILDVHPLKYLYRR